MCMNRLHRKQYFFQLTCQFMCSGGIRTAWNLRKCEWVCEWGLKGEVWPKLFGLIPLLGDRSALSSAFLWPRFSVLSADFTNSPRCLIGSWLILSGHCTEPDPAAPRPHPVIPVSVGKAEYSQWLTVTALCSVKTEDWVIGGYVIVRFSVLEPAEDNCSIR